MIMHTGKICWI